MSSRIRYPSDKVKSSSSNSSLKFILIISLISVIVVVLAQVKIFFSPYGTDSEDEEILTLEEDVRRETSTGTVHLEKDIQEKIEFSFFDTLTKPEKYTSLGKQEKTIPEASFNKKQESDLKVEPSQSIEKKEPKTQESPVEPEYIVQMGSFKKKSRAESFVAMLNRKGYQVSIKSAEISNRGLWYRVFLKEGFPDRESALKIIEKIKHKDNISVFLKRSSKQ